MTNASSFASESMSATSLRRLTEISWATESDIAARLEGVGRPGAICLSEDERKTQFLRRDKARVEADEAALRSAGLPIG